MTKDDASCIILSLNYYRFLYTVIFVVMNSASAALFFGENMMIDRSHNMLYADWYIKFVCSTAVCFKQPLSILLNLFNSFPSYCRLIAKSEDTHQQKYNRTFSKCMLFATKYLLDLDVRGGSIDIAYHLYRLSKSRLKIKFILQNDTIGSVRN